MKTANMPRYTPELVHYQLGAISTLGNEELLQALAKPISLLPYEIASRVIDKVIFIGPKPGQEGGYIPPKVVKEILRGKAVIHFSESIFDCSKEKRMKVILHEIAHFHLKHKSGLWFDLTIEDYEQQEKEAWEQVDKWLRNLPPSGFACKKEELLAVP